MGENTRVCPICKKPYVGDQSACDECRSKAIIIQCVICGNVYEVYSHRVEDQSACGKCQNKANGRYR